MITKKRHVAVPEEIADNIKEPEPVPAREIPHERDTPQPDTDDAIQKEPHVEMKRTVQHSNDDIFKGKGVSSKTSLRANDEALLQTRLKSKKLQIDYEESPDRNDPPDQKNGHGSMRGVKKRENPAVDDEESGI